MRKSPEWGWADTVQLLIERGHTLQDVRGYTLGQLRTFTEAAERAKRRELADQVVNLRAAKYPKQEFNAYLRVLTHGKPAN